MDDQQRCPRDGCGGRLVFESDSWGRYWSCLWCGFQDNIDTPDAPAEMGTGRRSGFPGGGSGVDGRREGGSGAWWGETLRLRVPSYMVESSRIIYHDPVGPHDDHDDLVGAESGHSHNDAPQWEYRGYSATARCYHLWHCMATEGCPATIILSCPAAEYGDREHCDCDLEKAIGDELWVGILP